ncbi:MAG: Mbeg1-like protein [Bifidobacterium bifidum]
MTGNRSPARPLAAPDDKHSPSAAERRRTTPNIIDYARSETRPFGVDAPFNAVDALVLASLVYQDMPACVRTLADVEARSGTFRRRLSSIDVRHPVRSIRHLAAPEFGDATLASVSEALTPDDFHVESGHNGLADPRLTQELYAAIGVNPRFACVRVDASDEHFSEEQQMQLRVVRSDQKGVMQHLTFSWQVSGNDFEYLPQVSPSSQLFNRSLNGWLESLSTEDRERAVDALFSVLRSSHADSISDLMAAGLKAVPTMINTFVGLSEADRRHLIEAMGLLMAAVRSRSSR